MRSHDAFTPLAISPFSIAVSSINLDINLDIATKYVGIDHFFENSITPLRRSRKAGSSNNVYCNATRQSCNDNNTFSSSSVYRSNLYRVKPCWLQLC